MATRALIGFIEDGVLTSTYNHYDGYPENLGKGLELYYSTPEEALKIASMGYISYLNSKTGEIEAKHKSPADKTELEDEFEEAMFQVAEMGDSYGADYIYIYNTFTNEWINVPLRQGINSAVKMLKNRLFEMAQDFLNFFDDEDEMNEDYNTKWKKFLNEEEKPQVKVEDDGTKKWYLNGKLHRLDGPAVEWADGTKVWYLNGKLHRKDDPAVEWVNGDKFWYLNGELHREDGPAIEYANGKKEWYLNGEVFTEEEFNAKLKKFMNNEGMDFPGFEGTSDQLDNLSLYKKKPTLSQVISQAMFKLQDEPKQMVDAYKKSLANDIRLNGKAQYENFSVEDFIEDYENYIADKMGS